MVTNGIRRHQYQPSDPRLGRHQELDARSLPYTAEARHAHELPHIQPKSWPTCIPTLQQGMLGSCTGNGGTAHTSQVVGSSGLGHVTLKGLTLSGTDAAQDERFAIELYSEATKIDGFLGDYPPDDTGSSGLAVAKVLHRAGLIGGYLWATSLRGWATLLQHQGTIVGMPWLNAFFDPDPHGFIDSDPHWSSSGVAGGHEICTVALAAWDERNPAKTVFEFVNSWGEEWGDKGHFRMYGTTYLKLRREFDIIQFQA